MLKLVDALVPGTNEVGLTPNMITTLSLIFGLLSIFAVRERKPGAAATMYLIILFRLFEWPGGATLQSSDGLWRQVRSHKRCPHCDVAVVRNVAAISDRLVDLVIFGAPADRLHRSYGMGRKLQCTLLRRVIMFTHCGRLSRSPRLCRVAEPNAIHPLAEREQFGVPRCGVFVVREFDKWN